MMAKSAQKRVRTAPEARPPGSGGQRPSRTGRYPVPLQPTDRQCQDGSTPFEGAGAPVADNQSDLVILGGGSGGYAAALRAAELGKSVVLIEKDKVGGTCLHRGCIPTKALLHAGEIADQARESAFFGVNATFEGTDMAGVHKYEDGVDSKNHKGLAGLVKSRGIEIVEGEGPLVGPKTVQVGDDTYTGANVIL